MHTIVIFASVVVLASCSSIRVKRALSLDGRIVGGTEANIKDFPYQASVRRNDKHICGGSIIAEDRVLTAAHCTDGIPYNQLTVRVGSSIHYDGESFSLRGYTQHLRYDRWSVSNDVSVLLLSNSLTFGPTVQPITLATERPADNTFLVVSGWGTLSESSSVTPSNLQAVIVPIVNQDVCRMQYPYQIINDVMICAGYSDGGKDGCQGDSGGPLVDSSSGELIGVVSWGYGCARPDKPGVYASVPDLFQAIQAL